MVKSFELQNKIKVVMENNPHVRTVSLGIWIKNGSIDETKANNGISHFLEHMMFKGTNKRSTRDIADEMAEVGGRINAFTGKEYMCYYAHVINEHFDVALDVLSDMICNSKLDEKEIEKEKKVIVEEYNMYEDSPEDVINDGLQEAIWPEHALGYNIIGTVDNIEHFTREDLSAYIEKHYIGHNMVISVTGSFDDEQSMLKKLEKSFESIQAGEAVIRNQDVKYVPSIRSFEKDIEQAHVCIAFPTISYASKEVYKLSVLNTLIGGGINSRLFQTIREEKGMAYSIYSFTETYEHGGLFVVYAATTPNKLDEVLDAVYEELDKLKAEGFEEKEIKSNKEQIKSNLIIGLESMNARMSSYGKSTLILDRIKSQDEIIDHINGVDVNELEVFTKELIDYDQMSISLIGPLKEIDVERIETKWNALKSN